MQKIVDVENSHKKGRRRGRHKSERCVRAQPHPPSTNMYDDGDVSYGSLYTCRPTATFILMLARGSFSTCCWTYSHHVRLQTRTRRKDGTENFGGFVYVLDGFLQRDFLLWVFMCSINFSLFFWVSFPATTPRATTPAALSGYHAEG